MENIKICESGCHDRSRNFTKDFDFIKEFSTNSEIDKIYKPHKQKDVKKIFQITEFTKVLHKNIIIVVKR